jgi:hypothetical protein
VLAAACVLVLGLVVWGFRSEWQEYQELSKKVRLGLRSERCRRCGGEFNRWRGSWGRVNASIEYVRPRQGEEFLFFKHEFALRCVSCKRWTVFWVRSDGKVVSRNQELGLDPDL